MFIRIIQIKLWLVAFCLIPRLSNSQSKIKTSAIDSRWILITEVTQDLVFKKEELSFVSCNNCDKDNPLSLKPNLVFYRFFGSNKEGFKYYKKQKGFAFCFDIKIDSSGIQRNWNIIGKWKLKGKGNKTRLILTYLEYNSPDDYNGIGIQRKVVYSVNVLNNEQMILSHK